MEIPDRIEVILNIFFNIICLILKTECLNYSSNEQVVQQTCLEIVRRQDDCRL